MRGKLAVVTAAVGLALTLGWSTAAFAATSPPYPPTGVPYVTTSSSTVVSGGPLTVSGCSFQANESITITLQNSTSVVLATTTADSSGCFSITVTIPSNTAPGTYTISAGGLAFTTITVTSAQVPVVATTKPLAITGADIAALSGVGAIALALGGMLILTGRRRRRTTG
jgi:hypothetical protein